MSHSSASSIRTSRSNSIHSTRTVNKRLHGRITKDDIKSAKLRRWNGRSRITTDWINLYQEPELCFSSGDLLVYLRQPGQSSRGPAFRVHSRHLKARGFQTLLDQCVQRAPLHASRDCLLHSCPGCAKHQHASELYIPAPAFSGIDATFDHHITTRNFFAWLYDVPLAGRALGASLVALKDRIDSYRPGDPSLTSTELIGFAESQKYLDFRECIDHALAALSFAERIQEESLWMDAFAHAVGMSHREIGSSLEYAALSSSTRALILESRLEMDVRLARASLSIETFFGDDLSGNFLGFHQAAREHFDRFRSFLHGFYIEKYGFWPPAGFSNESTRYSIYASIYSDFRTLYHHLVDPDSSPDKTDLSSTGGVCTLQNVAAFDLKHGFDTLPKPLPRMPVERPKNPRASSTVRRRSWNPVAQKKMDREVRNTDRVQALIDASNRDMAIMDRPIARRYSEFETSSVTDELERLSWIDGRKIRWILIYAILQTLISIMAAPKAVRNTERLSYSLCCHVPQKLPWQHQVKPVAAAKKPKELVPDIDYLHANASTGALDERQPRSNARKDRRQTMPPQAEVTLGRSMSMPRASSLRRFLSRKGRAAEEKAVPVPPINPTFCEILVHGYGNGLNEVDAQAAQNVVTLPSAEQLTRRRSILSTKEPRNPIIDDMADASRTEETSEDEIPDLSSNGSVSRESSNRSASSSWSKNSKQGDEDPPATQTMTSPTMLHIVDMMKTMNLPDPEATPKQKAAQVQIYDEANEFEGSIHINTKTWDEILGR